MWTLSGNFKQNQLHYRLSVAVLAILLLLPLLVFNKTVFNNAVDIYFSPDDPVMVTEYTARNYFPTDKVIVLMFEGDALYNDDFLTTFDSLGKQIKSLEEIKNVISVTTQDHISGSEDGFSIAPVLEIERLQELDISERPAIMLADRFAHGALIAEDESALSMIVVPEKTENSVQREQLLNKVKREISNSGLQDYLVATAGDVPLDVAQLRSMVRDNLVFIPLTTITGLIMVWLLVRRVLAVIISAAVIGAVASFTMALYIIFGQPFTLITSITSPLLAALSTAALVHVFNSVQYFSQRGLIGEKRIQATIKEVYKPILFTSLTTAAGLSSLGVSHIVPIAAFGLITASGVILMFFLVIYAAPQILIRWDHSDWPPKMRVFLWMDSAVRMLTHTGIRHPIIVITISAFLLMLGSPYIMDIKVETNMQKFFAEDHHYPVSVQRIDNTLVGTLPVSVLLEAQNMDDFKRPEYLKSIRKFHDWAVSQKEIDKATSVVDFIEEMHWGFNEEDDGYRKIPDDKNLISQYMLIYDSDSIYDFVDHDFKTSIIKLNMNEHRAQEIGRVLKKINAYLDDNLIDEMKWEIVGVGKQFSAMERLLVNGQIQSLGGALVIIFILMLILWRSFGQSALCMIPNLSPIALIFICMGIFGIWLDMATAMIASVAVGIAVDDTIHIFHGFITRVKAGVRPTTAIIKTNRLAGRAVMTTTIILTVQFIIVVTSQFLPTYNFGRLTALGLVTALVFDLLLLPALLMLIYNRGKQSPAEEQVREITEPTL